MSSDCSNGSGMSFSAADAFIYKSDLLLSPGSMMPMGDNNIGGFDEGPLEIVVGLLAHAAISDGHAAKCAMCDMERLIIRILFRVCSCANSLVDIFVAESEYVH